MAGRVALGVSQRLLNAKARSADKGIELSGTFFVKLERCPIESVNAVETDRPLHAHTRRVSVLQGGREAV